MAKGIYFFWMMTIPGLLLAAFFFLFWVWNGIRMKAMNHQALILGCLCRNIGTTIEGLRIHIAVRSMWKVRLSDSCIEECLASLEKEELVYTHVDEKGCFYYLTEA